MENLLEKKNKIESKLKKHRNKIYSLEDQLYDIQLQLSTFDNRELLKNIKLNKKQEEIIKSDSNNILVVAVPGSGKTHTLINRYIDLVLNKNVDPNSIILITFTKKSGQEMFDRINKYVPNKLPYYVGSLHGLGFKMLNKNDFSILDEKDTYELLYEISSQVTNNDFIVKNIYNIYDKKSISDKLTLDNVLENLEINIKYSSTVTKILKIYESIKNKEQLLDFNDLMILLNKFLISENGIAFREKIKYIFFDEFQDINPIQNSILEKFKEKSSIMVVGDDSQSIYSFRGSSVDYILNYKYDKCYYLNENYRSSPYIINFFDNIISHNIKKLNKKIISPKNENGIKPSIRCFGNNDEQFEWIAEQIKEKYNNGVKLKDICILSRANKSLTCLELYLKKLNIPYNKSSGLSLLNKTHVKDLLAFISLLYNSKNSISIKRILKLHKINYKDNVSIELFKFNRELDDFYNKFKFSDNNIKIQILRKYMEKLYPNDIIDIKIIINYFKNSDDIKRNFDELYLNVEIDNNDDKLLLSTIHSSKGLEWEYVYIIDCNNEILPCIRSSFYKKEINNYEEERRLFYVACSRAKNFLYLTYSGEISPLIKELNKDNYIGHNINLSEKINKITKIQDIKNKLKYDGYNFCIDKLLNTNYKIDNINNKILLSHNIECNKYVDNFILYVFKKILINNYKNIKIKIKSNFDENLISEFKDNIININNSLPIIKKIIDKLVPYNYKNKETIKSLLNYDYTIFEKEIVKYIGINKKIIINNDNTIIIDDIFFFIKNSTKNICDVQNILIAQLYSKNNKIKMYNPFLGILYTIN